MKSINSTNKIEPFTAEEIEQLKKGYSIPENVYWFFLILGLIGFILYLIFGTFGVLYGIAGMFILFLIFVLRMRFKFKKDLSWGYKILIEGIIERKEFFEGEDIKSYSLKINGNYYSIGHELWNQVEVGNDVVVYYLNYSKSIFKIIKREDSINSI
ncbi:MAG: hypothetical protein K2X86_06455 [Cytophagaceae bacterium]|nr:hypothetical protein [Cytophagaceae bacterium]